MKHFSQACENNKQPILAVLRRVFANSKQVLEIGSGTGQHAVFFAAHLPHLFWQTSDLPENHAGIRDWLREAQLPNLGAPLVVDADQQNWLVVPVDTIFSANTLHIMSWAQVQRLFQNLSSVLLPEGRLAIYGPFNYNGQFTSESNRRFDARLKHCAAHQGIRDFEAVNALAEEVGLHLLEDNPMPANNRLLVWNRDEIK
jgi:cyclopropane fatty-acyl-phospholipid synthase-like methyltransferase